MKLGAWSFVPLLLLLSLLILPAPALHAATNLTLQRPGLRTNALPASARKPGTTNTAALKSAAGNTNAVTTAQPLWMRMKSQGLTNWNNLKRSKAFYPVVIGVPICVALALGFLARSFKSGGGQGQQLTRPGEPSSVVSRPVKMGAKVYTCNVLDVGPEARHVWQFDAQHEGFDLNRQQTSLPGEGLPSKLVAKSWRSLFRRKLNVAWLPPDQVFLRAAQFPRSDFNETLAMVELQLEKLSPMPVAQIVWSIQVLPHAEGNLQTVIVMIVARNVVEEFLGKLEGQGYLADRLELPLIDQLQATPITEDGAWIYPETSAAVNVAVVAWWYGGVLHNLDLVSLPAAAAERANSLKEQLLQMAWAGELEGWLKAPPRWHLVANALATAEWEPALRQGLEQPITITPPLPAPELASLTAKRAAHADPRASLLPLEFSIRYQQQFVDRLWMRGLLAVAALYLIGVAIYGVALSYATFRTRGVENQVTALSGAYTNAMQLKARYQVLKDRQELKYAALDCWNLTARLLPESAQLDQMTFSEGRRLSLSGQAPADQRQDLIKFESQMRESTGTNGEALFDPNKGEHFNFSIQGGNTLRWHMGFELKRVEVQ